MDVREAILELIKTTLESPSLPDIVSVVRNKGELPQEKRPAIIVLDGDERSRSDNNRSGRGNSSPNIMEMTVEVFVTLGQRNPKTDAEGDNVGTILNGYRATIIKRLLEDLDLQALCGPSGSVTFAGTTTDLARGRPMAGEMGLSFRVNYVLKVSDLT